MPHHSAAALLALFTVIPLLGALIGWLTIVLPLWLLFRPRRPVRVLGTTMQGILRQRQGDLAHALGRLASEQLATHGDVSAFLDRPEIRERMEGAIREKIGDFLDTKLKALNPMFGMLLGGSLRDKVQDLLTRELCKIIPEYAAKLAGKFQEKVDVARLVEDKLTALDLDDLERTIREGAARELRLIQMVGAGVGLAIGAVQAVAAWVIL